VAKNQPWNERREKAELRELLVFLIVSSAIKNGRLRRFGHSECEDDAD